MCHPECNEGPIISEDCRQPTVQCFQSHHSSLSFVILSKAKYTFLIVN